MVNNLQQAVTRIPLPHGRGIRVSNEKDVMNKLVDSLPVVIALLAGLALVMMAEPERDPISEGHQAIESDAAAPAIAPAAIVSKDDRELHSPGPASAGASKLFAAREPANSEAAAPVPAAEDIDWISALYPELVHIARLEEQDPDSSLRGLLPMLASDDPVVRLAALESVADLNNAARLPSLIAALDDPSAQIRIAAVEALVLHGDPATSGAIESLVFDQDPTVRAAAVDALAVLGNPASIPVLAALLYDPDRQVRINAVAALGEIGGEDAIQYLRQLRYDADESIRVSASAILEEEALAAAF